MKRLLIAGLMLAGCSDNEIERAQAKAAEMSRDPSSAEFRNVRRCEGDDRIIAGEMNAKNGFGGYVGFMSFYSDRGVVTVADEGLVSTRAGESVVADLARRCAEGSANP